MKSLQYNGVKDPIFDGHLEPTQTDAYRSISKSSCKINRPEWWYAIELLGESWVPPQGQQNHLLLRFAFSLEPEKNETIVDVSLRTRLLCLDSQVQPVAFDLLPRSLKEDYEGEFNASLGLDLSLSQGIGVSPGSVGVKLPIVYAKPVIVGFGIGSSEPRWVFKEHSKYPLIGDRLAYTIVSIPESSKQLRYSLLLEATIRDRFGPFKVGVPVEMRERLSGHIPE